MSLRGTIGSHHHRAFLQKEFVYLEAMYSITFSDEFICTLTVEEIRHFICSLKIVVLTTRSQGL